MRDLAEIRSASTEESQEGTRSGDRSRRSQAFSAPSRDIPDQPSPKTPEEYLHQMHEKSKYLTFNEQHSTLRVYQERFSALQKAERSKLSSPFAQSFLRYLEKTMPEKNNQAVFDSFRETWQNVIKREEFITAQLKNHEEQVKSVEEWAKKAFGEQLDQLPGQLQYLKSEWKQTYRELSSHQEHLRKSVDSAQCFDDILSARSDNYTLVSKLRRIQLRMLNSMDHKWHKQIIGESNRVYRIDKEINDKSNRVEELKQRLGPKESTHLENHLRNADFCRLAVKLKVDKSLTLASTTEPFDVDQRAHYLQTLKNDIEQYARLQTHLDELLTQYSTGIHRGESSRGDTFAQTGDTTLLSLTKALDATIRISDMPTAYYYNPLQITDKQISLIQDDKKSGYMQPKHILDTDVSIGRYNEMSYAFSGEQNLKTQINYAIKSQSNTYLLQDLMRNGLARENEAGQSRFGMDAASAGEIEKCIYAAHAIKIDAREICSRITLSNPNMLQDDMTCALDNGVHSFVVHNLAQVKLLYKNAKAREIETDVEIITRIPGPPNAQKTGGDKFGADLKTCEDMLQFSHHVGMKPKGMAVHVGWQVDSAEKMKEGMNYALKKMAQTFKNMEKHGIELSIVDLGGGWPNQFRGKPVPSISENAAIVRELMDQHFGDNKPTLILEPGNYLSAAAGVTKAHIINIDEVPNKPGMLRCVLDVGMFNGGLVDGHYPVSMIVDGKAVEALVSVSPDQKSQHRVVLFGPSCDSSDKVMWDVMISDNPEVCKRFKQMMEANNVRSEMLQELDSIDNSQKHSYLTESIRNVQAGPQLSIVLHGTGSYTSEYNVGKVGERGFNSIRNPELVILSQDRAIKAGASPLKDLPLPHLP